MTADMFSAAIPAVSPCRLHAVAATRRQTGELLAGLGPLLLRDVSVYCLDAGNSFDPLPLAQWLRAQGIDPLPPLENQVFISRAFTCYQLAAAVDALLTPLADAPARPAVLVLGIDAMFLDEDLRLHERRYLFRRILDRLQALAQRGLPILITCLPGPTSDWTRTLALRARMLPDVRRALPVMEPRPIPHDVRQTA